MTDTATEITPITTLGFGHVTALKASIKAVALAAGKDTSLPILTGVRVVKDGNTLTLAATDRYRLHVATVTLEDSEGTDFAVTLPAKELLEVTKTKSHGLSIKVEGDAVSFNDFEVTRTIRALDGEFPKYQSLVPARGDATEVTLFSVSPKFLADAAKAAGIMADRDNPVRFEQAVANKPVLFYVNAIDHVEFDGVIMPVRLPS